MPVFTPNGDGLSDTIGVSYKLSEGAYLEVKVKRDGKVVREEILLRDQGRVRDQQRITKGAGDFDGNLDDGDRFGSAVAEIGDVDLSEPLSETDWAAIDEA